MDACELQIQDEGFSVYKGSKGVEMLRQLWAHWKRIAHTIGVFQSRVLLTIFYFLILAPFGIGVRLFADPLGLKRQTFSLWQRRELNRASLESSARRQF